VNAPVVHVVLPPDETAGLERLNDARHRWGTDLLGGGELPRRPRPTEDEDGERGELRRRDAGRRILPADVAQSVDGSRVKAVRRID
jgi:hypothetical protein